MGKRQRNDAEKFTKIRQDLAGEISNFLFALGNEFVHIKNAGAAFDCFRYSVDLNEKNQPSVYNLGALYNVTGNLDGAYRMFVEAARMNPEDVTAKVALGEVARKLGKVDESRKMLEEVYEKDPENYMVLSAIAILNYDCGRLAEALEWNDRALERRPGDVHMMLNKALINMAYGRWVDSWGQYEFCLSYQQNERMRNLSMAEAWGGQEQEGKTLLVISDQGFGDAIQFSRYLKEAKEKGKFGKLTYLLQPDLVQLLGRVDGVDEVVGFGERMKVDYDAYSSLLGVMRVLGISPENCWRPPHILTHQALDCVWKSRVASTWDGSSRKVGVTWAGDPRHGNDHARSVPFSQFMRFLQIDEVQLFSFQVGPSLRQLAALPEQGSIVDLGSDFRTFDDTASALAQMDLLITCDTAMSHLAGCMGVPCWLLVANPPEWRWLLSVATTPWYGSTKIYRQEIPKDWGPVVGAITQDLIDFSLRGLVTAK